MKKVFGSKLILTCTFTPSIYSKQGSKCILLKMHSKVYHFQNAMLSFACKWGKLSHLTITWPLDILIQSKHIMDSKLFTAMLSVLVVLVSLHQLNCLLQKMSSITYYLWKKRMSFVLGLAGCTRRRIRGRRPVLSSVHWNSLPPFISHPILTPGVILWQEVCHVGHHSVHVLMTGISKQNE